MAPLCMRSHSVHMGGGLGEGGGGGKGAGGGEGDGGGDGGGGGEGASTTIWTWTLLLLTVGTASTATLRAADSSEVDLEGIASAAVFTELVAAVSVTTTSTCTEPPMTLITASQAGCAHPRRATIFRRKSGFWARKD